MGLQLTLFYEEMDEGNERWSGQRNWMVEQSVQLSAGWDSGSKSAESGGGKCFGVYHENGHGNKPPRRKIGVMSHRRNRINRPWPLPTRGRSFVARSAPQKLHAPALNEKLFGTECDTHKLPKSALRKASNLLPSKTVCIDCCVSLLDIVVYQLLGCSIGGSTKNRRQAKSHWITVKESERWAAEFNLEVLGTSGKEEKWRSSVQHATVKDINAVYFDFRIVFNIFATSWEASNWWEHMVAVCWYVLPSSPFPLSFFFFFFFLVNP